MNKFRKTLLARTKDKKFKPRTHCVNDEHRLPPPYSTQEIQPRVFVLCEYGESVFNVDGNNEGIASEVRQELLQAVAAFDKECSSKTYAVALADAQLTNRVCPIERDPDAVALNMLQAKSRAVGDCRAFFVRDPGGPLVLAAISKVGSVDAQDKGIRRAGNRYREHQQFLQSI